MARIEAGLRKEWGPFGLLRFESVAEMLAACGDTTFITLLRDGNRFTPCGALQTTVIDVHGDSALLRERFPSFEALTEPNAMHEVARHGGDTAVLLQITVFGAGQRGLGLGSLLRDAALNLLDEKVAYALTTTPLDTEPGGPVVNVHDVSTYTAAMRFHERGGASATLVLPSFKARHDGAATPHGSDVIVMRYARHEEGHWPVYRPTLRLHHVGPVQARIARVLRHPQTVRPWWWRPNLGGIIRKASAMVKRDARLETALDTY